MQNESRTGPPSHGNGQNPCTRSVAPKRGDDGKLHVVALSGGKDSTALALRLAEVEPRPYVYAITATGDELPDMLTHWQRLSALLGSPLVPVSSGMSLSGLIRRWDALPNSRSRWCTRKLKIEPYYTWLAKHAPAVSYVGLRADEESRAGMQFPSTDEIEVRFPMREWGWSERDVWNYLESRDITIPARTDCARCYDQTLGEWWRLWHDHLDTYKDAEREEESVLQARGIAHTFRSETRDTWPAALKDLRQRFEAGHIPPRTVQTDDLFLGGVRRKKTCRVCSL
jgi:3'-phosphoadenosine 5'-phosphosulfate sulfotransferase (PAPS reductase)/FAD synthetase